MWGERSYGDGSTRLCMIQQYRLASMAARLSSTGISHHNLLPHIPSFNLSTVNSNPSPGIAPQSLNPISQPLHLPGALHPCLGMYGCSKGCLILIPFRLPQISCFTLSLKYVSSDPDNCGDQTPASVPPPTKGKRSPTNTPVFLPSFFILPSFAWFYIFFPSGQVLLSTLSWCSACTAMSEGTFLMYYGERCTPRLPTPPPSCTPSL